MNRRNFIQAVSAFLAVAAVAPKTLAIQPVDWCKWNTVEMDYADGKIRQLRINNEDFTYSREARVKLAEMIEVGDEGLFIGRRVGAERWGTMLKSEQLTARRFVLCFSLKIQDSGLAACAVDNGTLDF